MPSKNRNKVFKKNGIYHAFNRGVDKRKIFMDEQDYAVFLHLLKYYLSSPKNDNHPLSHTSSAVINPRPIKNLNQQVNLLAFCLMPNHFHLLLKQKSKDGMTKLIHKLSTIYSMYFNRRHKRIGHLFQSCYKAVLIFDKEQLLHVSRYIHLNPIELTGSDPVNFSYSSMPYHLGNKHAKWVKPYEILKHFKNNSQKYKKYVLDYIDQDLKKTLGLLAID